MTGTGPAATNPAPPIVATVPPTAISVKWVENLYKECGREITLAYTTLNQMKNWAMVIAGAVLSGLAFGATAGTYPSKPMIVGVVVAFAFTLRFFIRAMLCYINLSRWNTLQGEILAAMIWLNDPVPPASAPLPNPAQLQKLSETVQNLYFDWHSPISRSDQVASNLKLGFSLLFALCLFFLVWGAAKLYSDHLIQGLLFFAVGSTFVELRDFFTSRYFDTKAVYEKRKKKPQAVFPHPQVDVVYVWSWIGILLLSLLISFRDKISLGSVSSPAKPGQIYLHSSC